MGLQIASGNCFRKKKSEIVFLGDCLRPDADGRFGGVNLQTRWLLDLLSEPVSIASGLQPRCVEQHPRTGVDASTVYRTVEGNSVLEKWAKLSTQEEYLPRIIEAYQPHLSQNCFCIGFELPAMLRRALLALGVPYIDLWIHPIRFMDDLLIAATSNCKKIRSQIAGFGVTENEVRITAGLRRATLSRWPKAQLSSNTLLVAGQTRDDKSQISRTGQFFDLDACRKTLEQIVGRYDQVITKAHPWDKEHPLLTTIQQLRPDAHEVEDNIYYLMSQPAITGLLTVNSSCAVEAEYFGLEVHRLKESVLDIGFGTDSREEGVFAGLSSELLIPDTWRSLMSDYVPVTRRDGWRISEKPNRLRIALRAFWGFHGMDHDVFATPLHADLSVPQPPRKDESRVNVLPGLKAAPGAFSAHDHKISFERDALFAKSNPQSLIADGPNWEMQPGQYRLHGKIEIDSKGPTGLGAVSPKDSDDQPIGLIAEVQIVSHAREKLHARYQVTDQGLFDTEFEIPFSIESTVGGFEVLILAVYDGRTNLTKLTLEKVGSAQKIAA